MNDGQFLLTVDFIAVDSAQEALTDMPPRAEEVSAMFSYTLLRNDIF